MMISVALDLYVRGGRDSHSWCMCVVGHGYGWLGGGWDGGGGWHVYIYAIVAVFIRMSSLTTPM